MKKLSLFLILFVAQCQAATDVIIVINEMPQPIYVGLYYTQPNALGTSIGPANLSSNIFYLRPLQHIKISRPPSKSKVRRELIFSFARKELRQIIDKQEYKSKSKISVESGFQKVYHIALCKEQLCGYSELSWRYIKPVKDFFKNIYNGIIKKFKRKHPYETKTAIVRVSHHLCPQENNSIAKRIERAHPALENFIGESIPKYLMPRIAICVSGGCMRAALSACGLFEGFDDIGLLNSVLYAGVLSGSTWFLAHYLACGMQLNEYEEQFIKSVSRLHAISPTVTADELLKKLVYGQEIGLIDFYGIFLANQMFRNINNDADRQKVFL